MDNLYRGKISNLEKINMGGTNVVKNVYVGEVVHNEDPLNAGRIKVRIPNIDINKQIFCKKIKNNGQNVRTFYRSQGNEKIIISDQTVLENINSSNPSVSQNVGNDPCSEIPWSTPFLPKHFQVIPKVGEMVKVILFDTSEPNLNREWVGPIISLKDKYTYDDVLTAGSTMNTAPIYAQTDPTNTEQLRKRGEFTGGFSEPLDVAIQSRNNADIVMPTFQDRNGNMTRGGEVLLRAGKLLFDANQNSFILNDKNPAYFRLKVLTNKTLELNKTPDTHAMLFSDYISFISHKNGEKGSEGITKINPILENDKQIEDAFNSLQPMVRGKFLIEFLELIRNYVANHDHPYAGLPATNANSKPEILEYNLNKILSPNIRIN